jgi:hypothetical protein
MHGHVVCLAGTGNVIDLTAEAAADATMQEGEEEGSERSYLLTTPPSYSAFHSPFLKVNKTEQRAQTRIKHETKE